MRLNDISLSTRLGVSSGFLMLIITIIGPYSLIAVNNLAGLTEEMYNHPFMVSNAVRDIKADVNAIHRSMKDVALSENAEQLETASALVDEYERKVHESFDVVFDRFLGDMTLVENSHQAFENWKTIRDRVIELRKLERVDEAVAITKGEGAEHVANLINDTQAMVDFASHKAEEYFDEAQVHEKRILKVLLTMLIALFIIGIVVSVSIARSIIIPLNDISDKIRDISQGHLKHDVTFQSRDEIGQLADSFRALQTDLQQKAKVAERIASLDFSTDIQPRSEKDELGRSFNAMTTSLRTTTMELTESEEKYRTLTENLNVGVYRNTPSEKGGFIEVNPEMLAIFGYSTKEEFLRLNVCDTYLNAEDRISFSKKITSEGFVKNEELIYKRKDGTSYIASDSAVAIKNDDGEVAYYDGIIEDITERKEAEDALIRSEEKYHQLFDNMTAGFALHEIITNKNGECIDYVFLDINDSFERLTGLKKENLIGKKVLDVLPGTEPEFIRNYGNVAFTGEPIQFEQYAQDLNKYYQITAYRPEKMKFAVIFEDITDRKIAEQELNDFVFTVSHDLKAPLRKLDGFAKLLGTEYIKELNEEAAHYLERIIDNTGQMKQLIDDLLELSRIGRTGLERQKINLNEIVEKVKIEFNEVISSKNAIVEISGKLPEIEMNKIRVNQVFSNLIGNALKFTQKNTQPIIEIGSTDETRETCIYVKDNGIGIESKYFEKIFGIFQRLHLKEDYEGTGIGLTIVKRILDNIGGKARVESVFGQGTTFYFTIPK